MKGDFRMGGKRIARVMRSQSVIWKIMCWVGILGLLVLCWYGAGLVLG